MHNCSDKIHQEGGVAAPLAGQIFREILPYMEINQGNVDEVEQTEQLSTPDILGKSISDAEKILKENNLEMVIENNQDEQSEIDKENTFITEQTPNAGIVINKGSKVYIKY